MATTRFIDLVPNDWTEVSISKRAYLSNITDVVITYVEADVKPDISLLLGHQLNPHEPLRYTLDPNSRVFMRSNKLPGRIALSPGPTFFDGLDVVLPDNFIFDNGDNFIFQNGDNYELN